MNRRAAPGVLRLLRRVDWYSRDCAGSSDVVARGNSHTHARQLPSNDASSASLPTSWSPAWTWTGGGRCAIGRAQRRGAPAGLPLPSRARPPALHRRARPPAAAARRPPAYSALDRSRLAPDRTANLVLAPGSAAADWRFNVSHSGDLALLAFCRGRELGIDVEAVHAVQDADAIAAWYFPPRELAAFLSLAPRDKALGFFAGWTRTEALGKALGDGLRRPPRAATTPAGACMASARSRATSPRLPWSVRDAPGHAALGTGQRRRADVPQDRQPVHPERVRAASCALVRPALPRCRGLDDGGRRWPAAPRHSAGVRRRRRHFRA